MHRIHHRTSICVIAVMAMLFQSATRCEADEAAFATNTGDNLITLEQIEVALDMPMPQIDFPGEVPLSEILQVIETELREASSLPIQLKPDYLELELESIESLEVVLVRDVFFHPQSHTFRQALELVFGQTDPTLTFLPQDGHILITTEACAFDTFTTRVYDISTVIAAIVGKQQATGMAYGNAMYRDERLPSETPNGRAAFEISSLLMAATTPPAQWIDIDGEGGVIYIAGNRLTITQTYKVHRKIQQVLIDLIDPLPVNTVKAVAIKDASVQARQTESTPQYLLLAFAVCGWVLAFFLGIVAVLANRST